MEEFVFGHLGADDSAEAAATAATYHVGDRVRVKSTKEFGIVSWLKTETKVELWVLQNDLQLARVPYENSEIENDAPLSVNAIYVNRQDTAANLKKDSSKVAYAKIVERRSGQLQPLWTTAKPPKNLPKPPLQQFLSQYDYRFEGGAGFINGCFVSKNPVRDIQGASEANSFFSMIERQVPLIYIPGQLRMEGHCIAYRGDNREPKRVFQEGFAVWEDHATPVFRSASDGKPHYDILSPSGVCASGRPEGGCIFPLIEEGSGADKLVDDIYLYAFVAYQPFATCQIQAQLLQSPEKSNVASHKEFIQNLLKAEEIVVGKEGVAGHDVFAACRIYRKWRSDQWVQGASLSPKEFYFNENARLQQVSNDKELETMRHLFSEKIIKNCYETPTFS